RAATIERLQNWLLEVEDSSVVVLARSGGDLIGGLILCRTGPKKLEINPGTLGGHPLVSRNADQKEVGRQLIQEAISWSLKEGFEFLQIWLQRDTKEDNHLHAEYAAWYGSLGFSVSGISVDMICILAEQKAMEISIPQGFQVKKVGELPEDSLYQCYHDAFQAGDAQFFFEQNEKERRQYFNTLGIRGSLNNGASLALMKHQEIVGFTFVVPYGEGNLHLSCICIHPSFAQRGLGKLLLLLTMQKAIDQGIQTMTLYTDTEIRAFELYRKNGWTATKQYIKYQWKANNG
ncbi:MAG: GNAT family N-acetyltransferase, partial [Candidatus Hodarchaeota archaeon]